MGLSSTLTPSTPAVHTPQPSTQQPYSTGTFRTVTATSTKASPASATYSLDILLPALFVMGYSLQLCAYSATR